MGVGARDVVGRRVDWKIRGEGIVMGDGGRVLLENG